MKPNIIEKTTISYSTLPQNSRPSKFQTIPTFRNTKELLIMNLNVKRSNLCFSTFLAYNSEMVSNSTTNSQTNAKWL